MAFIKKTVFIVLAILVLWVLVAPGCMTFRITDEKAIRKFSEKGLELKTQYLKLGDRAIHYVMVGSDTLPTLILIHGSPSSWNSFTAYLDDPNLLQHFRIIAIDRPGFGFSDFGKPLHLDEQLNCLMGVIESTKNGKPIYLAGHSLGAPLAIKMAASAPELFNAIMLISASVSPELEPKEYWRYVMEKFPLNHLLPGSFRASNTELLFFKEDVKKLVDDFPEVKCAVYLVHGEKDSWVPPENVAFARDHLVNASHIETLMLPGNHFIPWTKKSMIIEEMIRMKNQ